MAFFLIFFGTQFVLLFQSTILWFTIHEKVIDVHDTFIKRELPKIKVVEATQENLQIMLSKRHMAALKFRIKRWDENKQL